MQIYLGDGVGGDRKVGLERICIQYVKSKFGIFHMYPLGVQIQFSMIRQWRIWRFEWKSYGGP